MPRIAALALLACAGLARAEGPSPAPATMPPTLPAKPGDPGVFLLDDGTQVAGRMLGSGARGDVFQLRSGAKVRVAPGRLVGRLAGPDAWEAGVAPSSPKVRLTVEGRTLEGVLLARERGRLRVRTPAGAEEEVEEAALTDARFVSELPHRHSETSDPGRQRYLAGRQPGSLRGREWAVRTSAESVVELGYGVMDWLTVSAAVETPVFKGTPLPPLGLRLDASASARLGPVRLGAGLTASRAEEATALVLHAEAGVGTPRANLTLWAGPPLAAAGRLGPFEGTVVGVSAALRPFTHVGVVAEAWLTPRRTDPTALGAVAFRVPVRRVAFDLGAMGSTSGDLAPWFAISMDGGRAP